MAGNRCAFYGGKKSDLQTSAGKIHQMAYSAGVVIIGPSLFSGWILYGQQILVFMFKVRCVPRHSCTTNQHHFHPSLSPVVSLSLLILHEWMRTQSSNLLQRTGGDHRGGCAQPGRRTFTVACLCWISGWDIYG